MDSISNAVSDSCTPQIVPDIELQTVDGKTVIVITVAPGPNRPYYLKSKGKMAGQIGIAGRNVEANMKKLKEQGILVRHGSPRNGYWEILE